MSKKKKITEQNEEIKIKCLKGRYILYLLHDFV